LPNRSVQQTDRAIYTATYSISI